jgi:flagellin-like hook-associated protein FlgL
MTRTYLKGMNSTLSNLSASADKLTTGRSFTKISENVSSGVTALKTRQKLYKNQQLQENIKTADEELQVTETNLMSIKEIADTLHEQSIKLQNDTNQGEYETFAQQFESYNQEILSLSNCTYNDKYALGGTSNGYDAPFTINENGNFCFNGIEVNSISKENGIFVTDDGKQVPESEYTYMDIGLGLKFSQGELDTNTAFKVSVSGLDCLGYGTEKFTFKNDDGSETEYDMPNNLCELISGMTDALHEGDMSKFAAYEVKFKEQTDKLVTNISEIGVRTNFLDSNLERLDNEEFLLTEKKSNLEDVEDSDELIKYKSFQYSWMLTLQYGSKVIPQSLMDFVT